MAGRKKATMSSLLEKWTLNTQYGKPVAREMMIGLKQYWDGWSTPQRIYMRQIPFITINVVSIFALANKYRSNIKVIMIKMKILPASRQPRLSGRPHNETKAGAFRKSLSF